MAVENLEEHLVNFILEKHQIDEIILVGGSTRIPKDQQFWKNYINVKKAIASLFFGGSKKRLSDGVRLRGDTHALLLGDPSTAKSQFLKICGENCSNCRLYLQEKVNLRLVSLFMLFVKVVLENSYLERRAENEA
ncbi:DNA replication licensing factor MCM3 like 3 [Dendrobium catenatum]|uniref:DNA replication licensing factor MCM3 like 3 n=1 Tax=Dendrobium catenatum TaxID=906689 RepID=A0A2I0XAX8_9ASPA|nr:DNA replication licensing factor MCM3 like 3 [Dendrobium catenatum]